MNLAARLIDALYLFDAADIQQPVGAEFAVFDIGNDIRRPREDDGPGIFRKH